MYCIRVSFAVLTIVTFGSPQLIFDARKHCNDDLPLPGRSCVPAPLTLDERSRILHRINAFRNAVAADEFKWRSTFLGFKIDVGLLRNLSGGASDMEIMHWDEDLARKAQKWANKCETTPNGRDGCQVKGDVYATFHLEVNYDGPDQTYALDQLFLKCIGDQSGFSHIQARGTDIMAGFRCYDALSWGEADEIGCGRVFPSKGKTRLVCSVTPCCWPQAMRFTNGVPRTNCKHANQGYSARYPNLCAPSVHRRSDIEPPDPYQSDDTETSADDQRGDTEPTVHGRSNDIESPVLYQSGVKGSSDQPQSGNQGTSDKPQSGDKKLSVRGRTNDFYQVSIPLGVLGAIIVCVLTLLTMKRNQQN